MTRVDDLASDFSFPGPSAIDGYVESDPVAPGQRLVSDASDRGLWNTSYGPDRPMAAFTPYDPRRWTPRVVGDVDVTTPTGGETRTWRPALWSGGTLSESPDELLSGTRVWGSSIALVN